MEILTSEQMRRVDRRAIDTLGIPGLLLMESAGLGLCRALLEDESAAVARGVLVLCGKGNNGGDGLVLARHLRRVGVSARVLLLADATELRGDAATNLRAARGSGITVHEVGDEAAWAGERQHLASHGLVIDALLGTGIRGGARGLVERVIEDLNRTAVRVVSVDIPSGLDGDRTSVEGAAVRAARTYTLCRPKLALVLGDSAAHAGVWRVLPIGIPDDAVREERPDLEWLDADAAGALLAPRGRETHKGSYGHLLALAGSRGKSGAAVLLARAALRSGVGLVTVATPRGVLDSVAAQQAEVMTEPLPETAAGTVSREAPERIAALLADRQALAVGPGLGTAPETRSAVLDVLARHGGPAVVDADALNAIATAGSGAWDTLRATGRPWVLTPHPGEAGRLLGTDASHVQADRLAACRELARRSGAVVVLKGHRSLVGAPDGRVSINASGNPGMASAGTGDVLTGVLGALLARGLAPRDAARLAVHAHGDAGDRAAAARGEDGLTAGDLIEQLPAALAALLAPRAARHW